ncbi:hypothetical protein VH22019_00080 [Vibrio phage VH2_2019]|nr:hypothetical protein VH22019_00080 [Vibrio phage VH2_2019]
MEVQIDNRLFKILQDSLNPESFESDGSTLVFQTNSLENIQHLEGLVFFYGSQHHWNQVQGVAWSCPDNQLVFKCEK